MKNIVAQQKAVAQGMKAAQREKTGYVTSCDDVFCNVCKKSKHEKAPWNRT